MKSALLAALIVSTSAFAQLRGPAVGWPIGGSGGGSVSTDGGQSASNVVLATTGNMTLYVYPTGDDSTPCDSPTAGCATIQAAVNKIPKLVRHPVTVFVDAGSYVGFDISGFNFSPERLLDGGYIQVNGALANASVATGTATGTSTTGTPGSTTGPVFGTMTDAAQTWTVDDLKGKLVEILTGVGAAQFRIICSNTATVVTVCGTWTAPTASGYAIRDWATKITTGLPTQGSPTGGFSQLNGIQINSNSANSPDGAKIEIRNIQVDDSSNTMAFGLRESSGQGLSIIRFKSSGTSASFVPFSIANVFGFRGTHLYLVTTGPQSSYTTASGSFSAAGGNGTILTQSLLESAVLGGFVARATGVGNAITQSKLVATGASATAGSAVAFFDSSQLNSWTSNLYTCVDTDTVGVRADDRLTAAAYFGLSLSDSTFSGCGMAVNVVGKGVDLFLGGTSTITGTVTGIQMTFGAKVQMTSTVTVSGGTQDFLIDGSAFSTADLAASPGPTGTYLGNVFGTIVTRQ